LSSRAGGSSVAQLLSLGHCLTVERKDRGSLCIGTISAATPAACPGRSAVSSSHKLACSDAIDHYNPQKMVQKDPHERTNASIEVCFYKDTRNCCAHTSGALGSALGRARFHSPWHCKTVGIPNTLWLWVERLD